MLSFTLINLANRYCNIFFGGARVKRVLNAMLSAIRTDCLAHVSYQHKTSR